MKQTWSLRHLVLPSLFVLLAAAAGIVLAAPDVPLVPTSGAASPVVQPAHLGAAPVLAATVPYTTLIDAQSYEPQTLDPHWAYGTTVLPQVYETLLSYSREVPIQLVPQLATEWEASADATVFTFTIRSGVAFHAGGTLDAHDVAYSFWRGMIQDSWNGPMYLWFNALFEGVSSMDELPGDDEAKCQAVKDAVAFDDALRTVTFYTVHPGGYLPFLLTTTSGSILDQEWMAANGEWAASCADWRDYHQPAAEESLLYDQMNGTGPFRFDHWTAGEIGLARNGDYWRSEPAWPGGPSGPAALEAVLIKSVPDWSARRDMLLAGEADLAAVSTDEAPELEPWVWGVYSGYQDREPAVVSPTGSLRLYRDLPGNNQTAYLLNFDIVTDTSRYIGSGALDGDGIPPDFFDDVRVRRAFGYAMDWTTVISDAYAGQALRARGPIPAAMLGYTEAQPVLPYSLTLATAEFQQAWGGQVWTQGFSMTIPYNTGNIARQRMAEVLAQNVQAINPDFKVTALAMEWADVLPDFRNGRLPAFPSGWIEDYHHPHNWAQPFLTGTYATRMRYPQELLDLFTLKIEECVQLTEQAAAQTCYEEIQSLVYEHAVALWGVQGEVSRYLRTEVRDAHWNPASAHMPYYYALSKGLPPASVPVSPDQGRTAVFTTTVGATASLEVPAGAVGEAGLLVFTPDVAVSEHYPGGYRLGGVTFDLEVCLGGECLAEYAFGETVTMTLDYGDANVAGLIEQALFLYTWDGTAWVDTVSDCGWPPTAYGREPEENRLIVPLCHASRFALVGDTYDVYLPLSLRDG